METNVPSVWAVLWYWLVSYGWFPFIVGVVIGRAWWQAKTDEAAEAFGWAGIWLIGGISAGTLGLTFAELLDQSPLDMAIVGLAACGLGLYYLQRATSSAPEDLDPAPNGNGEE